MLLEIGQKPYCRHHCLQPSKQVQLYAVQRPRAMIPTSGSNNILPYVQHYHDGYYWYFSTMLPLAPPYNAYYWDQKYAAQQYMWPIGSSL